MENDDEDQNHKLLKTINTYVTFSLAVITLSFCITFLIKKCRNKILEQKTAHFLLILLTITLSINSIFKLTFLINSSTGDFLCKFQNFVIYCVNISFTGILNFFIIFQYIYIFQKDEFKGKIKIFTWALFGFFVFVFPLVFQTIVLILDKFIEYPIMKICSSDTIAFDNVLCMYCCLFNLFGLFFCIITYRKFTGSIAKEKSKSTLLVTGFFCLMFSLIYLAYVINNFMEIQNPSIRDSIEYKIYISCFQFLFSLLNLTVVIYFCFEDSLKRCIFTRRRNINDDMNNVIKIDNLDN